MNLKPILVPLVIVLTFFVVMGVKYSGLPTEEELNQKFIVVNPLDLTQISGFSKYRSCMGHDYRGPTKTGKKESTPRSMKHYIKTMESFYGKNDTVVARAPFDGIISNLEKRDPERTATDQQVWLTPETLSKVPRNWHFVFFHINLKEGLTKGSKVKAGEVIGTATLFRQPDKKTDNFDMAVKFTRPMASPMIDEVFTHMATNVLDEYQKYGITPENVVISEEFRDKNLCPTTGEELGGDVYFPASTNPEDMIFLKR